MPCRFLSTPSARRATRAGVGQVAMESQFLSTPSARRATVYRWLLFSPVKFLSTPSARRATIFDNNLKKVGENFYPRPPRGGRRISPDGSSYSQEFLSRHERRCHRHLRISIHALREEGDRCGRSVCTMPGAFLSTPSARRATGAGHERGLAYAISIHALREEGDRRTAHAEHGVDDFYPRPPRGGRPLP